jgi:hypothetical protein
MFRTLSIFRISENFLKFNVSRSFILIIGAIERGFAFSSSSLESEGLHRASARLGQLVAGGRKRERYCGPE